MSGGTSAPRTVVVTGASGNVGTGTLRALHRAFGPDVRIRGVCRRPPRPEPPYDGVEWHPVDLTRDDARARLTDVFAGADAVVHLAWAIQPVRDEPALRRVNIDGTAAVLGAVVDAGVPHLVQASSLAVYGDDPDPATEDAPPLGQPRSAYSRQKIAVEAMVQRFAADRPDVTVTLVRPTLVVQWEAAGQIVGLFLGRLVPRAVPAALRDGVVPLLPLPTGTVLQFVHADDVGDAVSRILRGRVAGVFNLAADALDGHDMAAALGARALPLPRALLRTLVRGLFRVHAVPLSPGWFDVAVATPVMDTGRARRELGWVPGTGTTDLLHVLVQSLAEGARGRSPALR